MKAFTTNIILAGKKLPREIVTLANSAPFVSGEDEKFYGIDTWAQYYKTFSVCNLPKFIIS